MQSVNSQFPILTEAKLLLDLPLPLACGASGRNPTVFGLMFN
jgi:hypothetical protein